MKKYCTYSQRVLPSGKVSHCYRERDPATGKWKPGRTVCPAHVRTKAEAEAFVRLMDTKLAKKALAVDHGLTVPTLKQEFWSLKALFAWYAERPDASPRTVYGEACMQKRLLKVIGEDLPALSLTTDALTKYQAKQKETYAVRTVNMDLQLLKAALNRAVKDGKLPALPCQVPKPLQGKTPRKRVLTPKEGQAILTAALLPDRERDPKRFKNPDSQTRRQYKQRLHDQVAVYLYSGLRRDELFGLRWQDVDLARREMTVETRKRGGGGNMHEDTIPLHPLAFEVFARLHKQTDPAPSELIFGIEPEDRREMRNGKERKAPGITGNVECYRDHRFLKKLKALAKAAGIKDWHKVTIHGLRHSFCSELADTAPLHVVRDLARHKSLRTTEGYVNTKAEAMKQSLSRLTWNAPVEPLAKQAENEGPEADGENPHLLHSDNTPETDGAQVFELQRSVG